MPPVVAAVVYLTFIVWLFRNYQTSKAELSRALLIPLFWVGIIASRSASLWLNLQASLDDPALEGTPLDRLLYFGLILGALVVLRRRNIDWGVFFNRHRAILLMYAFWTLSILWSDYSFVSLKRLIKELGNVLMVMVILSESNPIEAVRSVFIRLACLLVPLSVLLIKYYPDLGRTYNRWTWEPMMTGVADHKNGLGKLMLVSLLFLSWDLIGNWKKWIEPLERKRTAGRLLLIGMAVWCLIMADSKTSLVCTVLGVVMLLIFRSKVFLRNVRSLEVQMVALALLLVTLHLSIGFTETVVNSMGRDMTFTTRSDIWEMALKTENNPLVGSGFHSFWLTEAGREITDRFKGINQVHNGYLETYLNGGLAGLAVLLIFIVASERRIKRAFFYDQNYSALRLSVFIIVLVQNFTEATFNWLSLTWVLFLLVSIDVRPQGELAYVPEDEPSSAPSLLDPVLSKA